MGFVSDICYFVNRREIFYDYNCLLTTFDMLIFGLYLSIAKGACMFRYIDGHNDVNGGEQCVAIGVSNTGRCTFPQQ
jgi:hypothetical protein